MTTRANIKITILQVLDRLPAAYTQRVSALRAEVSLDMSPSPGTADIDLAIRELEALRLITSTTCLITGERKYAITDAIVSIAALILIGFINYIIYRR